MNKKANTYIILGVTIILFAIALLVLKTNPFYAVVYGDNSYRTITTDAFVNDFGGLTVNYSINAARNQYDYSQAMVMFVKVNDEWLSADGIIVTDGNNVMRSLVIPKDELLSKNVVEFFYKAARSHPADTTSVWCWANNVRDNRKQYNLDDKMASWTAELYGLNVINTDLIAIGDSAYGVMCGFRRSPGLVTQPSLSTVPVYTARSGYSSDPLVAATTLHDLMDLRVDSLSYAYGKQVVYLPAPEVVVDPEVVVSDSVWGRFVAWLTRIFT